MALDIPAELTQRLEEAAEARGLSAGDYLEDLLDAAAPPKKQWATLADLARHAKEAGMASGHPVDTSARSREILNTEFADYLKSRIDRRLSSSIAVFY